MYIGEHDELCQSFRGFTIDDETFILMKHSPDKFIENSEKSSDSIILSSQSTEISDNQRITQKELNPDVNCK